MRNHVEVQRNQRPKTRSQIGFWILVSGFFFLGLLPGKTFAYAPLTLRYQHHLFTIDPDAYPSWRAIGEEWTYEGRPMEPIAALRVDGDRIPPLPRGVLRTQRMQWNTRAIARTLEREVASKLHRAPRDVLIRRTTTGSIAFEGTGMPGRDVLVEQSAELVTHALKQGITDIILPVREREPRVTVADPELAELGIREIVAVGESDFTGSPNPRRHNIGVGLSKFNGHLIPRGDMFSFNTVLGKVDASTGYWKELVILGPLTLPEYGGGLCQVSTTAYRGVWEYGFPIEERRNHSFAVTYYSPQGSDATIYPPHTDMRFVNDSPGALLIQTHTEGNRAYFIYYGTRDDRTTEVLGPYTWDHIPPPPDREEFTTEIPPGEERKASDRHPGLKALWFRFVQKDHAPEVFERVYSAYEARGLLTQIGIEAPLEESGSSSSAPSSSSASSAGSSRKTRNTGRR